MHLFVLKRKIIYWHKRWWVRTISAVLILFRVFSIEYILIKKAKIPQPLNVEDNDSKYTAAKAKAKDQELIIYSPVVDPKDGILFSYNVNNERKDETVEFHSTNAQLSEDTLSSVQSALDTRNLSPKYCEQIDFPIADNPAQSFKQNQQVDGAHNGGHRGPE